MNYYLEYEILNENLNIQKHNIENKDTDTLYIV